MEDSQLSSQFNMDNVTIINGTSIKGASPTTRAELMKKFFTTADRQARGIEDPPAGVQVNQQPNPRPRPRVSEPSGDHTLLNPSPATVAIPNTPSSLLPPPKSNHPEKDDGGPYKMEMVTRMEELQRGEQIVPPCDRCRRLHMDCLKNLTACMGCTRKHAKCSWKDVKEDELRESGSERRPQHEISADEATQSTAAPSSASSSVIPLPAPTTVSTVDPVTPPAAAAAAAAAPAPGIGTGSAPTPASAPSPTMIQGDRAHRESNGTPSFNARRESAPLASRSLAGPGSSPRRAVSDATTTNDRRASLPHQSTSRSAPDYDDPDANQRLMQAIWDTVDHHARGTTTTSETTPVTTTTGPVPVPVPQVKREVSHEREQEREQKMVKA